MGEALRRAAGPGGSRRSLFPGTAGAVVPHSGAGEHWKDGGLFLHHLQRLRDRAQAGGLYLQGHRPGRRRLCAGQPVRGGECVVYYEYPDGDLLSGGQGRGYSDLQQRH